MNLKKLQKRLKALQKKPKKGRTEPAAAKIVKAPKLFRPDLLRKSVRAHIARQEELKKEILSGKMNVPLGTAIAKNIQVVAILDTTSLHDENLIDEASLREGQTWSRIGHQVVGAEIL